MGWPWPGQLPAAWRSPLSCLPFPADRDGAVGQALAQQMLIKFNDGTREQLQAERLQETRVGRILGDLLGKISTTGQIHHLTATHHGHGQFHSIMRTVVRKQGMSRVLDFAAQHFHHRREHCGRRSFLGNAQEMDQKAGGSGDQRDRSTEPTGKLRIEPV